MFTLTTKLRERAFPGNLTFSSYTSLHNAFYGLLQKPKLNGNKSWVDTKVGRKPRLSKTKIEQIQRLG